MSRNYGVPRRFERCVKVTKNLPDGRVDADEEGHSGTVGRR